MTYQKIYENYLKEKELLEKELVDINLHSKLLWEYLIIPEHIGEFDNLSFWFHIAHSIKNLNYDGVNYDAGYFMCRPAFEYEEQKQTLYENLVKEITFFSYLYSGLEAIINQLTLKKCPKNRGKINATNYFIKKSFSKWESPINYYNEILSLASRMFNESYEDFDIQKELNDCTSYQGLGLKFIYKIRNKLMHGDFFFPEPIDHSAGLPLQPEIINLSSRLILIYIQILFLAKRKNNYNPKLSIYNSSILTDKEMSEKNYLKTIHIKRAKYDIHQLYLDFK